MSDKHERLLAYLSRADGWVTAAELADRLGVTTRSVRSYVTAVKALAQPLDVIESSTAGYRLDRELYATFLSGRSNQGDEAESPRERVHMIVRRLGDSPAGVDVFSLAESLFVSESTIEADLRKVRSELGGSGLSLVRQESTVRLEGTEGDLRRLLSRMFRDEGAQGFLEIDSIEREFALSNLRGFKTDIIAMLDAHGYVVNEYGISNVLLHVAIALTRASKDRFPEAVDDGEHSGGVEPDLAALIERHFDVRLGASDLNHLTLLLTTRVVTLAHDPAPQLTAGENPSRELVRAVVGRVAEEYLVDLDDDEFVTRLSLHVDSLIVRAKDSAFARNPMSRSLKTAYPMIYELAVFIASEIQTAESIVINDDEISYIALHVGSYLERQARQEERITCAIVCPNYYDTHLILRQRLESVLGDDLQIEIVITRTDVDWSELATDLIVTTIESTGYDENVVVIQPFVTEGDVDSLRRAIARVRRHRRRLRLKNELLQYFDESMFFRNATAPDETSMITTLGDRMQQSGIIGPEYVTGAIAREQMSSTAFTDTLAVPHALAMSATRTAICIAVNEQPMDWGENRVNVIALIAFSASDRTTFQAIFDQFVSVFADREVVRQIIRRSADFPSFIEELVRAIDI